MGAGASTRPAHQHPDGLYQHSGPGRGRCPLSGPGTPCAAAAAPQPRRTLLRLVLLCSTAPAAVCCCVTPHTRPTSLPASERCAAALKARHPSQCPPSVPRVRCGPTLPPVASPHLQCGPLKSPPRAGSTARPKGLSGIPAPLGGPSCGGGPGSAGACARHAAPHIGPSRAGAAPLVGTPGPHPAKQCRTQGSASHPRRRFYQNGGRAGRCSLPGSSAEGQAVPHRQEVKAATLPRGTKGNARPRGGECHTGERHARPRQAAYGGHCVAISGAAETETRVRGPCGRTPTAHHPPKERKPP